MAAQSPIQPAPPLDHWTRAVLVRLAGLGLIDAGEALAAWPLPGARVLALLDSASRSDSSRAATYRQAYDAEVDTTAGFAVWLAAGGGLAGQESRLRAGTSRPAEGPDYPGPQPVADEYGLTTMAYAAIRPFDPILASLTLRNPVPGRPLTEYSEVAEAYAAATVGSFDIRAGRVPLSFGMSADRGFVLHTPPPFAGVAIDVAGFRLPWFLRGLGTVRISNLVARMERSGDIRHPWFGATRVTLAPSPSLVLGVQRALIFGGEGNEGVTVGRVLLALIGMTDVAGKDSDFENQVAAFDAFWKLPGVPASVHGEWAFDDAGGAILRVPAIALGFDWHALPFATSLGAGIEAVVMTPSVAGHPPWYQHTGLGDGWTDRGDLLGHPLGGHGREVAVTVSSYGTVQARARAWWRDRGEENLFAPDRVGGAVGLRAEGILFRDRGGRLRLAVDAEHHESGWAWGAELFASLHVHF